MIRQFIGKLAMGSHLESSEMATAMELICSEQVRPSQIAAFLVALRAKGETVEDIVAAAKVVNQYTPKIRMPNGGVVLDRDEINLDEETTSKTCSLNGGRTNTFNISTATALVAAGGGLKVAKFGARAESSFCGSADVVAALGVKLDLTLTEVERCIRQVGIGCLYAQLFHSPLHTVTQVREEIGLRTIFNLIGPLSNPGGSPAQVLGVYQPDRVGLMTRVLKELGCQQAMVVYGQDTLDEFSITGVSQVGYLNNGNVDYFELVPEDVGLQRVHPREISGGDQTENARLIRDILQGAPGPRRDVVLINAAAAFMVGGRATDLAEGMELARESIDSGRAAGCLDALIDFTANCGVYQHKDVS